MNSIDTDDTFQDDPPRLLQRVLRRIAFIVALIGLLAFVDWLSRPSAGQERPVDETHALSVPGLNAHHRPLGLAYSVT